MHKTNRKNTMTIISVVISLLIVAGLTYAWMSQRAAMTTLLSIEPPDTISIIPTGTDTSELTMLDLDFHENSDDTNENGTIHIYRPVCIKSTERIHQLEIVHTTNLKELSFNIYPAFMVDNGESGIKISYSKDTTLSGKYINQDSDGLAKVETLENYTDTDTVEKHAYPLYWIGVNCTDLENKQDGWQTIISYSETGADQSVYYKTYYVLEISWKESSKETDLFYIMAQNVAA